MSLPSTRQRQTQGRTTGRQDLQSTRAPGGPFEWGGHDPPPVPCGVHGGWNRDFVGGPFVGLSACRPSDRPKDSGPPPSARVPRHQGRRPNSQPRRTPRDRGPADTPSASWHIASIVILAPGGAGTSASTATPHTVRVGPTSRTAHPLFIRNTGDRQKHNWNRGGYGRLGFGALLGAAPQTPSRPDEHSLRGAAASA